MSLKTLAQIIRFSALLELYEKEACRLIIAVGEQLPEASAIKSAMDLLDKQASIINEDLIGQGVDVWAWLGREALEVSSEQL